LGEQRSTGAPRAGGAPLPSFAHLPSTIFRSGAPWTPAAAQPRTNTIRPAPEKPYISAPCRARPAETRADHRDGTSLANV